jgi:hypothetical protein
VLSWHNFGPFSLGTDGRLLSWDGEAWSDLGPIESAKVTDELEWYLDTLLDLWLDRFDPCEEQLYQYRLAVGG